jgi:hypothetical protein
MALPSVEVPRYELTLPSQDVKIQFRPFLVKEEKLLLIAMESKDNKEIVSATKEILKACTFDKLDIDNLPMFDIEYILLQVRSKSVGEISKFRVLCPDDKETLTEVELDLSTVNVNVDDEHTNKIIVDETRNLGLVLNYPTLNISQAGFDMDDTNIDAVFDVIISSIDHIYEGDKIYPAKDSTKEELKEFVESMSQEVFKKVKNFFDTMPQLRHEIEVENPKTKIKSKVVFRGLQDFFQ